MFRRLLVVAAIVGIAGASVSCSKSSIQTDPSVREERASGGENPTGPVVVAATLLRGDRSPMIRATFHLMTIKRDAKGGLSGVTEHLDITSTTDAEGNLHFEVPREEISGIAEFSLGYQPDAALMSVMLRRAKEMLTFKADAKTKRIHLGEVIMAQF